MSSKLLDQNSGWGNSVVSRADKYGICMCINEELPGWHFQHRGIKNGYRYCRTWKSALMANFYFHNESINIWSHYIAAFVTLIYFARKWPDVLDVGTAHIWDKIVIFAVIIFGNILPLLASAMCHNFYCIDKSSHKICWFMDFFGIISGMLICGCGYAYFTLYCNPTLMRIYFGSLFCFYLYGVHWCWSRYHKRLSADILQPRDRFPEFSFSLSTFVTFASFVPLALTWIYKPEYRRDEKLYWILVESTISPALLSVGVVMFAQGGIPERFCKPNTCDFIGHSHQFWHFCTATVMFSLSSTLIDHFHSRIEYGCMHK